MEQSWYKDKGSLFKLGQSDLDITTSGTEFKRLSQKSSSTVEHASLEMEEGEGWGVCAA